MKQFSNALIWSIFLTGSVSFAKVPSAPINTLNTNQNAMKSSALSDQKLMEELTGKKDPAAQTNAAAIQMQNLKKAPLSIQHYYAGLKAVEQKNYILAIKHFNTVIKKYPLSGQVKPALLAKAKVYQEMGLQNQAQRNLKLAQLKTTKPASQVFVQSQEKNKTTK